jgi:alpha/beta superfamily hydrolase
MSELLIGPEPRRAAPSGSSPERPELLHRGAGRREILWFRAALAVIVVAVADDAFLHPEPGTSAADHLASGLVPVAIAAVAALAYPRLRPGLRGVAALVCGVLALTGGVVDGFRHVAVDRLAGDDLTAMLAGVAGAALVVLGALTLWRTRRRDEQLARRYGRRALIGVAALILGFLVVFPVAFAINATHRARTAVAAADLGRPYQRVQFVTSDGLQLAGWYVPSRNGAAVIAAPGRSGPVEHARLLARHGYGVLLFDRRGEGESEGDFNAFGWGGDADLKAAVTFLAARPDVDPDRIGGVGLSVGGEMMLEAAAEDERLRAVVSEGAGVRSLAEHWDDPALAAAQKPISNWVVQTLALTVLANQAPPPGLTGIVSDIAPRPLLLIRGLAGQEQEALNGVYHDAAREPKAVWEVPGAGHTAALSAKPQEYERRVIGFFDRALLGDSAPGEPAGSVPSRDR